MERVELPNPSMQPVVDRIGLITRAWYRPFKYLFDAEIRGGSFTLAAAPTTAVIEPVVRQTTSRIVLMPTNAAAAALMAGSRSLYISAKTDATGFTVATADGTAAAGTETFDYLVRP